MPDFTAHNIRLDDGTQTGPFSRPSMESDEIFLSSKRLLNIVFGNDLTKKTIVDVGCLEGGYTTEFARLGMDATGIEIRRSNILNCMYIKDRTNLPNLCFIQDDAYNIADHGHFDVSFVCGLLYHLDRPRKFLEDIAKVTKRMLIVDTHIAPAGNESAVGIYGLSRIEQNELLNGRWFREFDDKDAHDVERLKWAAYSNNRSFWIDKLHLFELLQKIGFDVILEIFDSAKHIVHEYTEGRRARTSRVMFAAIKSTSTR